MRPFDSSVYPPAFRDGFFAGLADCPQDLRQTTPELVPQGPLYERRVKWLAGAGSHLLTPTELHRVREMLDGLEIDLPGERTEGESHVVR